METELFWKLLEPEHGKAQRFCRRLTGSLDDGDDLYQDAVLTALRKFGGLSDHGSFRPWLYRVIINSFRNRFRGLKRRRRAEVSGYAVMTTGTHDPAGEHTARRWLDRAFAALGPEDRALVMLFELEGWTVAELAAGLNKPEGTIKSRLSRARRKMRKVIEKHLPPDQPEPLTGKAGYALPQDQE